MTSRLLEGVGVSAGVAVGPAFVLHWGLPDVPHRVVTPEEVPGEIARLREALASVQRHLERLKQRVTEHGGAAEAKIFDAQVLMLHDPDFLAAVERLIQDNQLSAERAFEFKALELRMVWAQSDSAILRQRRADLVGISIRVLQTLMGQSIEHLLHQPGSERVVVMTRELTPGLTVEFDREHVAGFASVEGTRMSHAAILAHSLGIPCVMGLVGGLDAIETGTTVVLDGAAGTVLVNPSVAEVAAATATAERRARLSRELERGVGEPAVTRDGVPIALRGNVDLPEELEAAAEHGAEGVGLVRTEFLVVGRTELPDEDEQAEYFSRIAHRFPDHPVVIRTYDLGGDKFPAPFRPAREANPFLGWRAIRVCLDQPELLLTQARAMLRARRFGDVQMLLPLVTQIEEVAQVRTIVAEAAAGLQHEGVEAAADLPVGVMIETPAAALMAEEFAGVCDFLSVGTNDLTQYTLAVDRGNARLAHRFSPFHPAVVRTLDQVNAAARAAGVAVSVCGEMASDPRAVVLLIGLGYRVLSISPPRLPLVRWVVRQLARETTEVAARAALRASTVSDVLATLDDALVAHIDPERLPPG